MICRRYIVRGSVQGVGYRYFAQLAASELKVTGTVRNLDDGSVEVVAAGTEDQLSQLAGRLRMGPSSAQVRGVDEQEAPLQRFTSFQIKHDKTR